MSSKIMQSRINFYDGLVIDNFAGGGGASTGIELALSRPVDLAINHDKDAIAMHEANHPFTRHLCESVWDVDPREATNGNPVMLAWFSPSCTHFSKARGCRPAEKNIRGLAWVAARWAAAVKPRVIILENVEEFKTWGPLKDGRPVKGKEGLTFNKFVNTLISSGYTVDWRELRACDYGTPTIRKRFFMIARSDGNSICWPEPTHGHGKIPYRTAAEVIDWSLPCPSIFDTSDEIKEKYGIRAIRPLAEATLKRIARGLEKFVINNPNPFIISISQTGFSVDRSRSIDAPLSTIVSKAEQCVVTPTLIQMGYGERDSQQPRVLDLNRPLGTITAEGNKFAAAIVTFIAKNFGGGYTGKGSSLDAPLGTVTAVDHHSLVAAHVIKFKGNNIGQAADEPLQTICSSTVHFGEVRTFLERYCGKAADDIGILNLNGLQYVISDIGMRMLTPRELFNAQGFPADYVIDYTVSGKPASKAAQIARCGNSVCPQLAEALIRANLPEQCGRRIVTMSELEKELVI
ncbi:MAG: DNA cytosine methyltransferase [Methanosarcinales archaeon]|jgi:DNA (cytosine-5)-methyltransferase 1|nr:DNA cytosine methyltransferase [Methanosarcinales archaeon]